MAPSMLCIVDSGASKADWALLDGQMLDRFTTKGFNPTTQPGEAFMDILMQLKAKGTKRPQSIYHYGAGCSNEQAQKSLSDLYHRFYPDSKVYIYPDLLGAARAVCKGTSGIVCILGTGSHAALTDGHLLLHHFQSLGYILGDEGSGTHLGRLLIQRFFLGGVPKAAVQKIQNELPQFDADFIYKFYQSKDQAAKLAALGAFVISNKEEPWISDLIDESFSSFIALRLKAYRDHRDLPVYGVGSAAALLWEKFSHQLRNQGFTPGICLQRPLDGLIDYHRHYARD
ncbi:MAG: hypothetical protein IT266_09040 [Saprospiraceae bacterium]|nr:hypothetical protein [Saprospiraceae bacterium]